jgi:hypothetical protein
MPYLGDYLGHLLSEIATARVQADLETVRMAELYASHPLLRHLPVPRFRLPTLTLDVPVVVQNVEQAAQPDISLLAELSAPSARERFNQLLDLHLQRAGIVLSERDKYGLQAVLDQAAAARAADQPFTAASARGMADEMVSAAVKFISFYQTQTSLAADPTWLQVFESELRAAALALFPDKSPTPSRLLVQVTNTALRDAGPAELMTRLRLSISEDAVEWTTVESQGQTVERLLPE